uniref:radical SAM protein n=1 Tax=Brachyspira catarrhinii TaxID=2528966 RepID=UPI003F4B2DA6
MINKINMKDIISSGIEDTSELVVHWVILDGCNYKCSYCFGQEEININKIVPLYKLKHAVNEIFKIDKNKYMFGLLGGEVTYYPHLFELIEYIYSFNRNVSISLLTNGSKDIEYFKKLIPYMNKNFIFTISIHLEYANLDHIKKLIILFSKNNIEINIKLMLNPDYEEKYKYFFNELILLKKEYNFYLYLSELREAPNFIERDSRYNKEFYDWLNSARNLSDDKKDKQIDTFKLNNSYTIYNNGIMEKIDINNDFAFFNNLKNFENFYCCGGINLISILSNGSYKGGVCGEFPIIGNIYEEEINLYELTNYVRCHIKKCGCYTNDYNIKYIKLENANKKVLDYRKKHSNLLMPYLLEKISYIENSLSYNSATLSNIIINFNKLINIIAWWIPVKKWRDNFKNKFII